jgi:hypothetical protein
MWIGPSGISGAEAPPRGKLTSYPTAGVAFRQPERWREQVKDKGKTVAWWVRPDSRPGQKPSAMITVECGKPAGRSLDEVAQALAESFHGVVDNRPASLDESHALRIIAKNDSQSLRPVEALATIHDEMLYLIIGGATAGHSVTDEMESIRASWNWMKIEPPFMHLNFRDEPLPLAGGAVTINVPALMHTYPTKGPDRVLDLGLHNFARNAPDFLAYVQVVPIEQGQTFDEYKSRASDGLRARGIIKKTIEWRTLKSDPTRVVSDPIEADAPEKTGGPKRSALMRWALVKLDDRRLVSVNFTLPSDAPGDRSTYFGLADRIVESIRPTTGALRPSSRENNPVGADE